MKVLTQQLRCLAPRPSSKKKKISEAWLSHTSEEPRKSEVRCARNDSRADLVEVWEHAVAQHVDSHLETWAPPQKTRGNGQSSAWRVIVQCVVSLLFLAKQCTHSAIVNARHSPRKVKPLIVSSHKKGTAPEKKKANICQISQERDRS